MVKKIIALFLILIIGVFCLSGFKSNNSITELAYVIALGLDVGENSNLKMSFQIAKTSQSSSTNSTPSSSTSIFTVDCDSIFSGVALLNNYLSKKATFTHCKAIIFSEELATHNISEYIYTLINDVEIRINANVIICKNNTEYFIKNSQPILEKLSARYYENIESSLRYTGYTDNLKLKNFFLNLTSSYASPHAILASTTNANDNIPVNSDNNYTAGNTPINLSNSIENCGIAVFKESKMVGELSSMDAICNLIVSNKLQTCTLSIPSPFNDSSVIDLNIALNKKSKSKVTILNDSPFIEVSVHLNAKIYSIDNSSNYFSKENLGKIQETASGYVSNYLYKYLYKTSKDFNTDINNFYGVAIKKYRTWQDWENLNWNSIYRNSFFKVNVNLDLDSSYMLIST